MFQDSEIQFDADDDEGLITLDAAPVLMAFDRSMRTFDMDGRLHVETTNISKANVCPYLGSEIPNAAELGLDPSKIYYLYRDRAELEASAPTYENVPLMMRHVVVNANDPQKFLVVGTVSNVRYVHPYLKASLAVWDAEAIKLIESGDRSQLSCGYRYVCDLSPGTIDGVAYSGIMRSIVANHVALVETGRAGPDVLVSDHVPQEIIMKRSALIAALAPFMAKDADLLAVDAAIVALAAPVVEAGVVAEVAAAVLPGGTVIPAVVADACAKDPEDKDEAEAQDEMDDPTEDAAPVVAVVAAPVVDAAAAMDAAVSAAVTAALASRDALHTARREVESILGVVAYDSAAEVYKAALTKLGVTTDGVDSSAFAALLKLATKAAAPAIVGDSATVQSMVTAFPGLARFN